MSADRPRVLVVHPVLEPGARLLEEAFQLVRPEGAEGTREARLKELVRGCQGIVSLITDRIGEALLAEPGLRCVANVGVGFDNVDLDAARRHRVMVTNTPGVLDEATADFTLALLLAAARRVVEGDRLIRDGGFNGWALDLLLGLDLSRRTLGVVGFGRIGRAVARRAQGFDMEVLYFSRHRLEPAEEARLNVRWAPLERLLQTSDFVSLHVPLTGQTRHLISTRELALMKSTAVLVNTSRGPVVDEAALAAALAERRLWAAALDVFEREPLVHPNLLDSPHAVLAPHLGSASVGTRGAMSELAARNLIAALSGLRPPNLVNPEVLA